MKKLLVLLVLVFSSLLLVACGDTASNNGGDDPDNEVITLTFSAADNDDYTFEGSAGEVGATEGAKDPALTLTVGQRYRIENLASAAHPFELLDGEAEFGSDVVLLSQREEEDGSFEDDSEVAFEADDSGMTFTLTQALADALSAYRCEFHPVNMRGVVNVQQGSS